MARWTDRHRKIVRELYDPFWFGTAELSERLGRSPRAIKEHIYTNRLHRRVYRKWTPAEEARLLEIGAFRYYKQYSDEFQGRSFNAIKQKLYDLRRRARATR